MHKKGEDVLNNFVKTLTKGKAGVESGVRTCDSGFRFEKLQRSSNLYRALERDGRLNEQTRARLRAPATGIDDDFNSTAYGKAAGEYQRAMRAMADHVAQAVKSMRARNEAGGHRSLNKAAAEKNKACRAWRDMVDKGFDEKAAHTIETQQDVGAHIRAERTALIAEVRGMLTLLGIRGVDFVECTFLELQGYAANLLLRHDLR